MKITNSPGAGSLSSAHPGQSLHQTKVPGLSTRGRWMTEEQKIRKRAYDKVYRQRPEVKARRKAHHQRPGDKARRKTYFKTYNRAYRVAHKEKIAARHKVYYASHKREHAISVRTRRLERCYGLSSEAYMSMLSGQGGKCAACGTSNWGKLGPSVHHEHKLNRKVLGILCYRCNTAAGQFGDDAGRVQMLVDFLKKSKSGKKSECKLV